MKLNTHLIGMPIIGYFREFKFFSEKYFTNKSINNKERFLCCLKKIISNNNYYQKKLDLITLGNMKLFDCVLHTLCCLSIIPKRFNFFKKIDIKELEFLMKGKKEIKPLRMLKWYGTNLHYFEPEIDENIYNKKILKYKYIFLDKKTKKKSKYSILGPGTFLEICRFKISKKKSTKKILKLYIYYIKNIYKKYNLTYLQIEEYVDNFNKDLLNFYKVLFKKKIKIFLCILKDKISYKKIKKIIKYVNVFHINIIKNFNFKLIKKVLNFCKISLGIIENKNIWINDYKKSLLKITSLYSKEVFLGPCGSFIHVPIHFENKNKIKYISFCLEKIKETIYLKKILTNYKSYCKFLNKNNCYNNYYKKKKFTVKNLLILKKKRKRIKKSYLGIKNIPSTTIGSFPQTNEIRKIRKLYENGNIKKSLYNKKILYFIKKNIKIQKKYNVDILVNGEPERSDMVEFFCKNYKGFIITKNGWVQSYGTKCVKPPILYKKPKRKESSVYFWYKNFRKLKGIVTGPNTIAKWSFLRENIKYKNILYSIAYIVAKEIKDLKDLGLKIIQIDEPAIKELIVSMKNKKKSIRNFIKAFNYSCRYIYNKKIQIHSHICYSNLTKKDLTIFRKMYIDVLTIESSRNFYDIVNFIRNNKCYKFFELGLGIYDVHSPNIPSYKSLKKKIKYMIKNIGKKNIWINPDCGLKTRTYKEVIKYLKKVENIKRKII
ncbi:hypothetical protein [Candidatus Vidania fulgoroideorum]